jgi:hypothetical protein
MPLNVARMSWSAGPVVQLASSGDGSGADVTSDVAADGDEPLLRAAATPPTTTSTTTSASMTETIRLGRLPAALV